MFQRCSGSRRPADCKSAIRQIKNLRYVFATVLAGAIAFAGRNAFGLGSDYQNGQPANNPLWPPGLAGLVNQSNRVHGFFVNAQDIFFFSGAATNFSDSLRAYSKLEGVAAHRLVLHEGAGEAKSPWGSGGQPCDWELFLDSRWGTNIVGHASPGTNSIRALQMALATEAPDALPALREYAGTWGMRVGFADFPSFARKLATRADPVSSWLFDQMNTNVQMRLTALQSPNTREFEAQAFLSMELESLIRSKSIYDPIRFANVPLQDETRALLAQKSDSSDAGRLTRLQLHRLLLEDAYPHELPITETSMVIRYVVEVHFWTAGKIALNQVVIPKNVEFGGDCFNKFESITNGMTRAEVEKKLPMDGGLHGVSPVRFIDPGCPHFKINVEFDFQHDARDKNRAIARQDDKVINVSKPYLEEPFTD